MADWPIFQDKDNVILVEVGKAEWELSPDGFQMGISSGALFDEIKNVLEAVRSYNPQELGEKTLLVAPAALPGSNEQPQFEYLGIYFSGIHIIPGSRKIWISLSVAFNVSVTVADGYNTISEFVPTIIGHTRGVIDFLENGLTPDAQDRKVPSFKLYDVGKPETIENRAVREMLKGGRPGVEI